MVDEELPAASTATALTCVGGTAGRGSWKSPGPATCVVCFPSTITVTAADSVRLKRSCAPETSDRVGATLSTTTCACWTIGPLPSSAVICAT